MDKQTDTEEAMSSFDVAKSGETHMIKDVAKSIIDQQKHVRHAYHDYISYYHDYMSNITITWHFDNIYVTIFGQPIAYISYNVYNNPFVLFFYVTVGFLSYC